jgi:hypothetical protein
MSDDFGTINVRRGERAREIEVMRQHYRAHRDALQRMQGDAPTEHLASEYQRLIAEIDRGLEKLDELEGGAAAAPPPPPPPPHPARGSAPKTEAGTQELILPENHDLPDAGPEPSSRLPLILGATLVALVLMAGLIWWASSDRKPAGPIIEEPATASGTAPDTGDTTATESATTAGATAAVNEGLSAAPPSHDYGTIRKGTRATRQFEISNNTDQPVSIGVARSTCRCLFYEHAPVIPPKAKENLTVTIDGARAQAGELRETVKITAKSDPSVGTTVDVIATIR